jgi:hypothetical protein
MRIDSRESGMKYVMLAIFLSLLLFTIGLTISYIRAVIWQPSGNTYSVPAPKAF